MQLNSIVTLAIVFISCSCTTVRHKSISRNYHGTNGKGGHWMLWRMPNKISSDSVVISASGFNVSLQQKAKVGVLVIISKHDTVIIKNTIDYTSTKTKVAAGKYKFIYTSGSGTIGVKTQLFKFNAGDSIALQVNLVNVERHFHENWRAKYMSPAQKEKHDKKVARLFERLDKIKERGNYKKYFRLRRRKAERWGFYY